MIEIRGFRALRFDPEKTGALDSVITPPYDVISDEERARLAAGNPFNMTHLILPRAEGEATPYLHADALLQQWIAAGVLRRDAAPMVYVLRQRFRDPVGATLERRVFLACMKLPEKGERYILGHERTFDTPVQDRLALLRATRANLEPIFIMYSDPAGRLASEMFSITAGEAPLLAATTADGVKQELWARPLPEAAHAQFEGQTLYIADGHHRFKTACAYRDEQRQAHGKQGAAPYDYIMAGFVAFEEPGLKIYPAHRVLPKSVDADTDALKTKLDEYFVRRQVAGQASMLEALEQDPAKCAMIMYTGQDAWLLALKEDKRQELVGDDRHEAWQDLDVAVLHRGLLTRLMGLQDDIPLIYEKDADAAAARVDKGDAAIAFLLRATRPEQVRACAEAFEPMPQKSTYFFPKLPSGTVIYTHF